MKKQLITLAISIVAIMTLQAAGDSPNFTLAGNINHEKLNPADKASFALKTLPTNFAAFKKLYDKAAVEPQGAAALFVVAMGLYRDNPDEGERAIAYALLDKFSGDVEKIPPIERSFLEQKLLGADNYAQPYIVNAYYQGATPGNHYTPSVPYTINVKVNAKQNYQRLSRAKAPVIALKLKTYGRDGNNNPNRWHHITVLKPHHSSTYLIYHFRDLLTGVLSPD